MYCCTAQTLCVYYKWTWPLPPCLTSAMANPWLSTMVTAITLVSFVDPVVHNVKVSLWESCTPIVSRKVLGKSLPVSSNDHAVLNRILLVSKVQHIVSFLLSSTSPKGFIVNGLCCTKGRQKRSCNWETSKMTTAKLLRHPTKTRSSKAGRRREERAAGYGV